MVARDMLVAVLEVVGALGLFGIAYIVGSTTLWLAWAIATAVLAGVTLLRLNWGYEPPPVS